MNTEAFESYIASWRATFPALALAELYASAGESRRLLARSALVMEWSDAVWQVSDERVTESKLGWWAEEWARIHAGEGRHPLAAALDLPSAVAPLKAWIGEQRAAAAENWDRRVQELIELGRSTAQGFASNPAQVDHATALAFAVLIASRFLAAVAAARPLALSRLPMDARAQHQISLGSAAVATAFVRQCAIELSTRLQGAVAAQPKALWRAQRGAGVLTLLGLRQLSRSGAPDSKWHRWQDAWAAWRFGRQYPE